MCRSTSTTTTMMVVTVRARLSFYRWVYGDGRRRYKDGFRRVRERRPVSLRGRIDLFTTTTTIIITTTATSEITVL